MKRQSIFLLITVYLISVLGSIPTQSVRAATLVVTNTNNSGVGSLRQVVASALSGDTITFSPSLAGQTITLESTISITKNITIDGSGLEPRVEISGGDAVRILFVDSTTVAIKNVILRNGKQTGLSYQYHGAAMFVDSNTSLTIQNVLFTNNSAYTAGAIYISPYANVTISDSEFTNNISDADASTIYVKSIGVLNLSDSYLANNSTNGNGAIYFNGATSLSILQDNVFENNTADSGGAVYVSIGNSRIEMYNNLFIDNTSTLASGGGGAIYLNRYSTPTLLIIENNTFYNNSAVNRGGAIWFTNAGNVYFNNNTLSHNSAGLGGNVYLGGGTSFEKIYNNIMANSESGGDCYLQGSVSITGSNNLVEDDSATCNLDISGDPELSALSDNGGATQTMAISNTAPVWNAGNNANCPETDQRGVQRPQDTTCDLGAYELDETTPTVTMNQADTQSDPTSIPQIYFDVVFSEPISVSTFSATDIAIGGDTGATTVEILEVSPNNGTTFQIAVSGMTNSGTLTATIEAGVLEDIAKNLNEESTSTDNSVTYIHDITSPTVVSIVLQDASPTYEPNVDFLVTFSEPVTGVDVTDFSLTTVSLLGTNITAISGSGSQYVISVSTGSGNGTLRLNIVDNDSIKDTALNFLGGIGNGNGSFSIGETYTVIKPVALTAPKVIFPTNRKVINNSTPEFSWRPVTGAIKYEVFIASDKGFADIVLVEDSLSTTFVPNPFLPDGTYYWRVRAYNTPYNPGKFNVPQLFKIDTTPPAAPTLTSPMNEAELKRSPILRWTRVTGGVLYELQVSDSSDFSSPNTKTYTLRTNSRNLPAMPDGIYYWRVRVKDSAGNWNDWLESEIRQFEIDR